MAGVTTVKVGFSLRVWDGRDFQEARFVEYVKEVLEQARSLHAVCGMSF